MAPVRGSGEVHEERVARQLAPHLEVLGVERLHARVAVGAMEELVQLRVMGGQVLASFVGDVAERLSRHSLPERAEVVADPVIDVAPLGVGCASEHAVHALWGPILRFLRAREDRVE